MSQSNNPTNCTQYSQSIKPNSLLIFERDKQAFHRMMRCFERDIKRFQKSQSVSDMNFIHQFTKFVLPKRHGEGVQPIYHQNVLKFYDLLMLHLGTIEYGSLILMKTTMDKIDQVLKPVLQIFGHNYPEKFDQVVYESLTKPQKKIVDIARNELDKLNAQFLASMLLGITLSFFTFESACRVCCSLVCEGYAHKVSKCQVMHHNDVWKTLKRLGGLERSSQDCINCNILSTCQFSTDFEALSKIYSYAIKVRMLANYREFFYIAQALWIYMMQTYIPSLTETIKSQKILINRCFP